MEREERSGLISGAVGAVAAGRAANRRPLWIVASIAAVTLLVVCATQMREPISAVRLSPLPSRTLAARAPARGLPWEDAAPSWRMCCAEEGRGGPSCEGWCLFLGRGRGVELVRHNEGDTPPPPHALGTWSVRAGAAGSRHLSPNIPSRT